ncbi:ABC transporter ATP-binding protein [Actinoplanes subglobosus]|uniref:Nickel import system ATP-binding protein NikD n=1 Tax=Actinoplanes subglobosus TaxID=1547892 RepID=A0ABV8J940_9ACTN
MNPLLTISGLTVRFHLRDAVVQAATDIDLAVRPGELLAVVGESGCGKSVLAHALLGLLPANATVTGRATLTLDAPGATPGRGAASVDLLGCGEKTLAGEIRGRRVGLIPQSPATALTPVRRGRRLLAETLAAHGRDPGLADRVARDAGLDAEDLDRYPFALSGGMAQRLATALALAGDPPLLIADEPTSGLDRPLVEHTLDLLRRRCDDGAAVLLITHDLAAAERVADTLAVMYAGRIVEHRAADDLFRAPGHPYTRGLLNALPDREFRAIPGHPPMLTALPEGCAFAARCERVSSACVIQPAGPVACHHPLSMAEVPA